MKFGNALVLSLALSSVGIAASTRISAEARLAQAAQERKLQDIQKNACFSDEDFTVYFKGKCDFDSLVNRMNLKVEENNLCINTGKEEVMLLVGKLFHKLFTIIIHFLTRSLLTFIFLQ